jgi:outer membrane protein assembly factor BamB
LRARAALAGALAWRTAAGAGTGSQPPTSAVVEQWSAAVAASRNTAVQAAWQRIQSQPTGATGGSGAAIDHTVMPRAFTSEVRGRWEGDVGTDAGHPPSGEVDWFARQFAAALVGEIAYLTNRYQIAAFDLARGQVLWNRGMGTEQGKTHRWPLAKCQPLVQGGRVYVRQMGQERPILLALKSDTGAVDWQTGPDLNVISDPFHVDSGLYAITAGDRIDAYWTLWLTRFDPHTGEIIAQRSLLSAADHWDGQLTGWVTPAAGGLVAVVAGSVFLSDLEGRIQWIRRQPLHPNHPDWKTHEQSGGPPLVASGRVVAFQPGACAVEAFDAATGSLVGSAPLVDVRRIVGIADQAVVVETPQQLVALDLADELRVKWSVGLQRLFDATVQADGSVLAVRRQSSLHDKWRVQLAWIDSKTGSPIDTAAIDSLNDNESWLGPLVPWRGGIVSFYGRNLSQPQRDVVMLSPIESGSTEERRPHPGDLSDTEDLWTHDLVERKVLRAIRDRLPGWTCLFAGSDARTGLTDHAGESGVVCTQSLPYRSVRLVSSVTVPLGRPRLVIRAGGEAGRTWTCRVRVRDRIVHEFVVGDDPGFNGWASWEVDLREFAGQTVSLVVEQAVDREPALGFWKQLEVVTSG